jgi:hypothetical protein
VADETGGVESQRGLPVEFTPLRRASARGRVFVFIAGPLLWLVALVLVAVVVRRTDALLIALAVTLVGFLLWLCVGVVGRRRRIREEREAERL